MSDEELVDGFKYAKAGDDHDGEIVHMLGRVKDEEALAAYGCSFFIAFRDGEVILAPAHRLHPWFHL